MRVDLDRHVDLTGKTFHELASALYSSNKMVALGFKEDNRIRINPGDPTVACYTLSECGSGGRVHFQLLAPFPKARTCADLHHRYQAATQP